MVKDDGGWESSCIADRALQQIAQLHRTKRVDASLHQRGVCLDQRACCALNHIEHSLKRDRRGTLHLQRQRSALLPRQPSKVCCKLTGRWKVKDERGRQRSCFSHFCLQQVAQLHRTKRVDASLHERRISVHRAACSTVDHVDHSLKRDRRGTLHLQRQRSALLPRQPSKVCCKLTGRWKVKDERGRQRSCFSHFCLQQVAQLHRTKRVDASLHERRISVHRAACSTVDHLNHSSE